MADTPINIQLATGYVGLTIELYPDGSDTAANSPADTLTEETNRLGLYAATITESLSGVYFAKVMDGSTLRATGWVSLADDASTYHVQDGYSDAATGLNAQQVCDAVHSLAPSGLPAAGALGDDTDKLLARITASATTSAAAANGDISTPIIRGDAYNTAAGNAFTISSAGFPAAVWDAVVTGTLKLLQGTTYSTVGTVAVTHDSDETITATVSFTSVETSGLVKDPNTTYELELTVGSDQRTLTGNWAVTGSDE